MILAVSWISFRFKVTDRFGKVGDINTFETASITWVYPSLPRTHNAMLAWMSMSPSIPELGYVLLSCGRV